jgi:hypothetical protein
MEREYTQKRKQALTHQAKITQNRIKVKVDNSPWYFKFAFVYLSIKDKGYGII